MDVLNRIKHTVSSLSTVLPGNPVTREYEVLKHIGSAGPGLLWKVYQSIKKSTRQEAAVFVLEKKLLERYSKREREIILEILKKGISQLTRLRHPSILTVQHPLEESRESLAFATEPVFASLANVLGNHENMPAVLELKDFQLYDVEIKYGLLQVAEGLAFLHNDVKMLHRNICPENIVLNKNGSWKLTGFEFSLSSSNSQESKLSFPFPELEMNLPPISQPNLDYIAPEYILSKSCSTASDMFSLGMLMFTIFNKGTPCINSCGDLSKLKQNLQKLNRPSTTLFKCLSPEVQEHVKALINSNPDIRPDAFQVIKLPFYDDVGVKTLQYLDALYQWDKLQKSHFYKGLPQVIVKMPKRVALQRVLPCLVKEYCSTEMVPFVLPNVLLIAEEITNDEFVSYVLQDLIPLFKIQEPVQVMLIFMQKMQLLLTKCPPEAIRNHVLPMLYHALESDAQQIQELCLSVIPSFAGLIEYSSMKNALLPRIKKLCLNTSYLSVRVNCLVCLGKLLEHLDKWLVLDDILPLLPQIPSKEPAVLMGILGIYKLTMTHKKLGITKDIMAAKVIPFLMPLTIENGLTLNQFNAIMAVVKEMVKRVETEHRTKLEQLNSIRQEHSSTLEMTKMQPIGHGELLPEFSVAKDSNLDSMFQDLGLGSFIGNHSAKPNVKSNTFEDLKISGQLKPEPTSKRMPIEDESQSQPRSEAHFSLSPATTLKSTVPSSPVTPKDLTHTLINSNLSNLAKGFSPNMNSTTTSLPATHFSGLGIYPSSPVPSLSYRYPGFNSACQPVQGLMTSSLDTLLPNIGSQRSRLPMKQMTVQNISNHPMQQQRMPSGQVSWTQGVIGNQEQSTSFQQGQSENTVSNTAKSELDDLFG